MILANIRIVTDSTSDIPPAIRERYGIEVVPLKVHFGNETFYDGETIGADRFYEKLAASDSLPTTSQPSPVDFASVYQKWAGEPDTRIISIHLSSAMSGTYQAATLAKSLLDEGVNVDVVDSKSASYGIGMLVVAAAKWAEEGYSADEILAKIARLRKQTRLYFLVDTLEYLQKGGRIGKAAALFGAMLNIKPILTIDDDGQVAPVDKVRGQKKAMARIIEMLKADFGDREVAVGIAHANALESAEQIGALLREHFRLQSLEYTTIGPVIGTHAGPGAIGIFMYPTA